MKKYFGVGAHKTGTSSLLQAFKTLKYNCHTDFDSERLLPDYIDQYFSSIQWASKESTVHFYQDSPWNIGNFYKKLYFWNPQSKFILTIRDSEDWFNSLCRWNQNQTNIHPFGSWLHRTEYYNSNIDILPYKDTYISRYEYRNNQIISFFKDKPDQLLILDTKDENKWEKLCKFTGDFIPTTPYPHKNLNK